jgi:hypothetical protein
MRALLRLRVRSLADAAPLAPPPQQIVDLQRKIQATQAAAGPAQVAAA